MSQDTRPSGEPSPGDMDHFNSEVYGELVSMRELQAKLGLCMRNQEAIHQRLDSICAGMGEVVDQLNGHKESWTSLTTWIQETSHSIADLEKSSEQLYTDIVKRPTWGNLADRVQELENDKEIERRANNA